MKENYNKKYSYTKIIIIWQPQKMWAGNFKFKPDRPLQFMGEVKGSTRGGGGGGAGATYPSPKISKRKIIKKKTKINRVF